jgi:hypothetical protein
MSQRAAAVDFADPALEAHIRAGLEAVESTLRDSVKSDYPFVTETSCSPLSSAIPARPV